MFYKREGHPEHVYVIDRVQSKILGDGISFFSTLPKVEGEGECDSVEYWFEFAFDGMLNKSSRCRISPTGWNKLSEEN
ncbi:MAG: hypothetical protein C0478_08535 [Planctomyces sp.]|nr:hypothetical protein [Planctomyces sp.]